MKRKREISQFVSSKRPGQIMDRTIQPNHSECLPIANPQSSSVPTINVRSPNMKEEEKPLKNKTNLGIKGAIYQIQLLVLFLKRGLEKQYLFKLSTEKEEAGKFDDLIFEINRSGKQEFRLLQAKHKEDESKKIKFNDLLLENNSDYTLGKYFFSYNDSKKQKLFKNKIKDVILFTNINLDLDSKFKTTKLRDVVKEIEDEDYILDFTNETSERKPVRYSFKDEMVDLLTPKLEHYNLTRLAKRLAKCIINGHVIRHQEQTDIFIHYHTILAAEVIDVNGKKFRDTFISNKGLSIECQPFREVFEQEMIKQSNNQLTLENINSALEVNKDINGKKIRLILSKNFGNGECTTWPENSISNKAVKDFFNNLVFAVNQPSEKDLDRILEQYFTKEYNNAGSLIYKEVFDYILKWVKDGAEKSISDKNFRDIIGNYGLKYLHTQYLSQIEKFKMKFDLPSLNRMALHQFLSSENSKYKILVIKTQSSTLSAIKVNQILQNIILPKQNFLFVEIFAILDHQNALKQVFEDSIDFLVFEWKTTRNNKDAEKLCIELLEVLQNSNNKNKKIIFIVENSDLLGEEFKLDTENFSQKLIDDSNNLCDLTLECQNKILDERKIIFQGYEVHLRALITDESKCFVDAKMLFQLVNDEKITIGKTSLNSGDIEDHYIAQQLERRWNIKGNINNEKSTFFVTTNCEGVNENHLERNQDIVLISNINEDFEKLRNKYYNRNIHHLKEEEGDAFIWQQSHGSLEKIRHFIDQQNVQCVEANDNYLYNPITILASEPGMGKTTLTTKLEGKLKISNHSLWVVRINFLDYSSTFERWTEDNIGINEKEAFKFLYKATEFETLKSCEKEHDGRLKRMIYDTLSSTEDAVNIVKYLKENKMSGSVLFEVMLFIQFYKEGKFHILFDGFDEIAPDYQTVTLCILKIYKAFKLGKIWVTTRPYNICSQLENELGSFSYNLRKFSSEDQRNYLEKFWKNTNFEFDDIRFNIFVNEIFYILSESINAKTKELLTTPLHLNMFADILQDNFKNFYNSKNAELSTEQREEIRVKLNLTRLYDNFVNRKYKISFGESSATPQTRKSMKNQKSKFIADHEILALHAIFFESNLKIILSKKEAEEIPTLLANIKKAEEKTGLIIAIIDGRPRFIHKTFAEYFSAKYLWKKFKIVDKQTFQNQYIEHDLKKCLIMDDRVDVCEFLESVASNDLHNGVNFLDKEYKLQTLFATLYEYMMNINIIDVHRNHPSKILLKIIETSLSHETNRCFYSKVVECKDLEKKYALLCICAEKGYQELVIILLEGYMMGLYITINLSGLVSPRSALWLALENSNLNVARIFIEKFYCIWLDGGQRDLMTSIFDMRALNVLKSCLKLNIADLSHVIHFALREGKIDVLHSLINEKIIDLKSQTDITSFHYFAFTGNLDKVKYYIEEKNVDINAKNSCGDCAVHCSAISNLNVFEYLVQKGADLNVTNRDERSCVHCIVQFGNVEILKFVVEQEKVDCNIQDKNGDTPLHVAAGSNLEAAGSVMKFLIEQGKGDCNSEKLDIVKFLIEQEKVDCNILNNDGYTSLSLANSLGELNIVKYITEK